MKTDLIIALGVVLNAVSIALVTKRLDRQNETIKAICLWNLEVMAKHNDLVDTTRKMEGTTLRLVQRVELLEERQTAPAKNEGRQWP
ncbi:hypothetical protein UFOVP227_2 [uncultured Caudovirales phage]|uniref:Uncharacterized protein n=1 Tax=uncultured Caudovirales phage TaxID=2100421 RepID=A0A6J7WQ60_9CAUD|nr:hypothetical protein UFOVP227_2 [uncultured Caudovirales phage]